MKKISLKSLYILSAIKSSLINLAALIIIIFIGISFYNRQLLVDFVIKTSLTSDELNQIEQFNLAGNKDAIDLFLIEKKSSHGLHSIEISKSLDHKDCFSIEKIITCGKRNLTIYQELPVSKGQYLKYICSPPTASNGHFYYIISIIIFFFNFLSSYLANYFAQKEIKKQLKDIENNIDNKLETRIIEFDKINEIVLDGVQNKIKLSIAKSNIQIIEKLQHDIDSPLATFEIFFTSAKAYLSEELRNIGQHSIERIQDILNSLKINKENSILNESSENETVAIYPILKRIISEKRAEYHKKKDVKIKLEIKEYKDYFVNIKKSSFSRTISNIINNSVESQKVNSDIHISIRPVYRSGEILIYIQDNGIGIPAEYIDHVFEYGRSFGKFKGTGIGLSQAKEYIESENGYIKIDSQEGVGTTIIISLNESPSPAWHTDKIIIPLPNVVIVDDDDSIHVLWKKKLSHLNINIINFKSSFDFRNWALRNDLKNYFFLFDLELIGSQHSGLDLIKEFSLQNSSMLVTSHFMNKDIQLACLQENIKMIPKESAVHIKVLSSIVSNKAQDLSAPDNTCTDPIVLIDDDDLVHITWKMVADRKNRRIFCFYKIEDFLMESQKFHRKTKIYIDSNLGNNVKGEYASKQIYDIGFNNIFITSGQKIKNLPPWIKGQGNKSCPLNEHIIIN